MAFMTQELSGKCAICSSSSRFRAQKCFAVSFGGKKPNICHLCTAGSTSLMQILEKSPRIRCQKPSFSRMEYNCAPIIPHLCDTAEWITICIWILFAILKACCVSPFSMYVPGKQSPNVFLQLSTSQREHENGRISWLVSGIALYCFSPNLIPIRLMTFCYSFEFIQQHPTGQFPVAY